ncbi:MAG: AraC family transcriptional regulator [Ideonella sp.]|nr:AraC family transcriptional regulator [Ideonella sp.]MCC7455814.1 AraC family transcriptional regulator [Nitrospira sp.]
MTRAASRAEYDRRMHRVLEAIDQRLDQSLDLASLAAVAHFSPYHFHRLFSAWMGETLGDYLRRRRLEVAAGRLAAQPRLAVLQVALSVGFGSGEAFSRAFKAHFGSAPSGWRAQLRQRKRDQATRKIDQLRGATAADTGGSAFHHEEPAMNVTLIDRAPQRVAYLRHTGPYGEPVSRFWQQQVGPWLATERLFGRVRYGISHDDPSITDPAKCRYDACVEVDDRYVPSGAALVTKLPGGRYASMPFHGTAGDIKAAWTRLLRDWLPGSRLQLDSRPCFELYRVDARYDAATGAFECQLCIPVAPL